jgi:hypothetical protein
MICHPCTVAGFLNAEANRAVMLESVAAAEPLKALCREWHSKCKDRFCPCQHIVGQVLNQQEIERLMSEDPDDRAIREAHGFSYEDDYQDRTLLCRNGCGETYFDISGGKMRECHAGKGEIS